MIEASVPGTGAFFCTGQPAGGICRCLSRMKDPFCLPLRKGKDAVTEAELISDVFYDNRNLFPVSEFVQILHRIAQDDLFGVLVGF